MYRKGIVFDNVGVLLEDPLADITWVAKRYRTDPDALNKAKDEMWVREFSVDSNFSAKYFWKGVFEGVNMRISGDDIRSIDKEMIERYRPNEVMLEYVRKLRDDPKVNTILWTNNSKDWFQDLDKTYGLSDLFNYLIVSGLEGKRKDNPEVIKKMTDYFRNEGCFHFAGVDDQEGNVRKLEQAGFNPIILHKNEQETIYKLNGFISD